jgi:hypothetical protein
MIHAIAGLPDLFTGFSPITPRLERSTNPAAGPDWNTEDIPSPCSGANPSGFDNRPGPTHDPVRPRHLGPAT